MGTTYCDAWRTKGDVVKAIRNDLTDSGNYMILGDSTVGNVYYAVIQRVREESDNDRTILVCLLSCSEGAWGYKDMDETMYPYNFTCPAKLIKLAGPTNHPEANRWREACARRASLDKAIRNLKEGDVVKLIPGLKLQGMSITQAVVKSAKPLVVIAEGGTRCSLKRTYITEVIPGPTPEAFLVTVS